VIGIPVTRFNQTVVISRLCIQASYVNAEVICRGPEILAGNALLALLGTVARFCFTISLSSTALLRSKCCDSYVSSKLLALYPSSIYAPDNAKEEIPS